MAQQSTRRGRKNHGFPNWHEHAVSDVVPVRDLPYVATDQPSHYSGAKANRTKRAVVSDCREVVGLWPLVQSASR